MPGPNEKYVSFEASQIGADGSRATWLFVNQPHRAWTLFGGNSRCDAYVSAKLTDHRIAAATLHACVIDIVSGKMPTARNDRAAWKRKQPVLSGKALIGEPAAWANDCGGKTGRVRCYLWSFPKDKLRTDSKMVQRTEVEAGGPSAHSGSVSFRISAIACRSSVVRWVNFCFGSAPPSTSFRRPNTYCFASVGSA